ncbi:T9SS type A sorting domain-containing protein [Algibacter sp.]|uniref:T9SS type A sorting domain-containing protein n=1 Tax=Algibacter sp. TaxID=1872428 RepID=UPI003C7785F7
MKKIYTTTLFVFALVALMNAQTTIYDSAFDEASYDDAGVQANLNAHPDWLAGHNNGTSIWNANANDQIETGANFAYSVLQTPITGVENDVITVTTVIMLGFNNQAFDADDTNMALCALTPGNPTPGPGGSTVILGQQRDGVTIQAQASTTSIDLSDAGPGGFATNPTISQANKSAYEIIMEYTLGADAASSTKKVRIRNVGTVPESSAIETSSGGLRQQVYDALTGSGAFYFNWALGFFQNGDEINRIVNNRLTITRNSPLLSTKNHNAFEFGMYPNPVKNELHINTKEPLQKVEIFDLLGKSVVSLNNVSESINVSSLSKSLYIIKLTSERGVSTKKFIKD